MSSVGDALSGGGSDATGVTDTSGGSFGDTPNLTDSDFAGLTDADIMGAGSGPTEFSQASNLANALSSGSPVGSSPVAAQTAAMTPPGTAAATGGDPAGAAGGTQSNTTPGSTPTNQNQQQQSGGGGGQQTHDPDHAPPSAVAELKALLKGLSGQPTGPTGPTPTGQAAPFALPTLAAGQTGAQSPRMALPQLAAGQTGPQSTGSFYGTPVQPWTNGVNDIAGSAPADASIPPGAAAQPARQAERTNADGSPAVDAQGNPVTAAGTPAADTPLPPSRPGAQTADAGGGGRQITVKKPGDGGISPRRGDADLPTVVPPGSAAHPLPTHKPGASPAPAGPATSSILNDISGVSTGSPTALADLAQAAQTLLPIVLPLLGGLFGGGGRRGGRFHGGRFTHGFGGGFSGFRGGMNAMRYHGGQHPMARGAWPYHHPQFGWHMHGRPPGPGWLPLHPNDAQALVGGQGQDGQDPNAPDPNNPPQEKTTGQPDDAFQKSGFSANPFVDALVKQESGGGQNIVSNTDKDSRGLTLKQGGNPNEISQGYFQIQNHPGGTWQTYGRQAGIDLNKYPSPRSAPLDVQWQVAQKIPIGQWGPATKAILRQKFGNFDPNMPFGQVAAQFGPAGGRLAAQTPSRKQPAWAQSAPPVAAIPNTVPVTSQPMVVGGP